MKKKTPRPAPPARMTLKEVMQKHKASFGLALDDGWANIRIDSDCNSRHNGKFEIEILNEDGYSDSDLTLTGDDANRIATFLQELQNAVVEQLPTQPTTP